MRRYLPLFVIALALQAGAGAPVSAQTLEGQTLTVSASAEVRAVPDVALVQLGVETQATTAQAAMADNSQRMERVVAALRGLGIPDTNLQTASINLMPIYRQDRAEDPPVLVGYRAQNSLAARLTDLSKAGAVLDAAVTAGANQVQGISFQLSDEMPYRLEALTQAGQRAFRKAEALARGLNVKLGAVDSAIESGYQVIPINERAGAADSSTPVLPGQVIVRSDVQVRFRLAQ
jgi:uncharacterized protein YggE